MRGTQSIKSLFRKLRMRYTPGAVILAYHRVTDVAKDPYNLAVSPTHFNQHAEYLKSTCSVMRLGELGEALKKRDLPRRAVAITFDDGYIDVFEQAYPILKSAQVPATVFIPSGLINEQREFWWDELERIFHIKGELPRSLNVCIQGKSYHWDIATAEERMAVFWEAHKLIRTLRHEDRIFVLDELVKWAGLKADCRTGIRTMNVGQLTSLMREGLVEIGAHTITHPSLSSLPVEEQRREIVEGREKLEELLGRPIYSFAYPYGDFTDQTVSVLNEARFSLACTMISGRIELGDDLYRLKRCEVHNWSLDIFAQHLESFFIS